MAAAAPTRRFLMALLLLASSQLVFAQSAELAAKSKAGTDAMAAGRYDEAVTIYLELAKALPADAGILTNLGMAQTMAGRPRAALAPLERAVKLQPTSHPAWLFLGTAYLEAGEPAKAVRPLAKAVETDPRSANARQMLADAYVSLDRHEEAGRELLKLTELLPGSARAWYGLGQSHETRARVAFEQLRKVAPDSPYEALLLADVLASEEKYDDAVELYRAAIEQLPHLRATGLEAIAQLYEHSGRTAQAAEERRKMAGLPAPDCVRHKADCAFRAERFSDVLGAVEGRRDAESFYWRARAHNELAVQAFSRLELLPPSPESHAFRAELYRNQGRHVESVAELREAAKLVPDDPKIQRELATSLYLSRDYESAAPLLEGLLKQDPKSAELNFMYGDTLLQAQKVESAIAPLEAAVRRDASLISARASLGRAYLLQGRPADAIPHLKAALGTDEDGSLHYQLARAYQATGQAELAKQMLAKYEEIGKKRKIK
jgi:predicted Zn-dependent protease